MGRLGVGVEWGEEWGGELLGMKERERIYIYMGCGVVFDFFPSSSSFCGKGKIFFSSSLEKESIRYFSFKAKKMSENRGTEVFLPV